MGARRRRGNLQGAPKINLANREAEGLGERGNFES
jgi:hypothetical protein